MPPTSPPAPGLLFVFDMDEVLYRYDWRARMARLTELTGLDLAELRRLWWNEEGELAAEAGRWATGAEYFAAFRERIGVDVSVDDWVRARAEALTPFPESHAAVARARELGRVSLLTNNGPLAFEHLHEIAPELVPLFGREHLRTSSSYGARKPDPRVFERMLAEYDSPAENTFFADDLPENVAGAASVGITAHLFTGGAALLAAVEEFAARRR